MTEEINSPIPETVSQTPIPEWNAGVLTKKVGWGVSKFLASKAIAIPIMGPLCDAFNTAGTFLQPYGLYFHADTKLLETGLPLLIFAALISVHDAAKLKTKINWL